MLHMSIETATRDLLGAFAWDAVIKLHGLHCCFIHKAAMERCKLAFTFDNDSQREKDTGSQQRQH